jgi:hypothetical protein
MKDAMDRLEQLVGESLSPDNEQLRSMTETQLHTLTNTALTERNSILQLLWRKAGKVRKPIEMEILVPQYQLTLIELLDKLHHYQQARAIRASSLLGLYQAISGYLEELLSYIEHHFPAYFNQDQKVPDANRKSQSVSKLLLEKISDPQLVDIALNCLSPNKKCRSGSWMTYRDLMYRKMLIAELEDSKLFRKDTESAHALLEKLIYMNYNSQLFIQYVIVRIHAELNTEKEYSRKIKRLLIHKKAIRQIFLKPGVALLKSDPHAAEQIAHWLKWEEYYTRKDQELSLSSGATPPPRELPSPLPDYVLTDLEGAHIYGFIKLFLGTKRKIILNHRQNSLIEKIAPSLATRRKKGLSAKSLVKYSDKINPNIIQDLKELLKDMNSQLDGWLHTGND